MDKLDLIIRQYLERFREELVNDFRQVLSEFLPNPGQLPADEITWLNPQQARDLIGLKSRNSMKKLRESGDIHYLKIGREFRYARESLKDYMMRKSTMRYKIDVNKKGKENR